MPQDMVLIHCMDDTMPPGPDLVRIRSSRLVVSKPRHTGWISPTHLRKWSSIGTRPASLVSVLLIAAFLLQLQSWAPVLKLHGLQSLLFNPLQGKFANSYFRQSSRTLPQRMQNKSHKNSGTFHLGEISRSPVNQDMSRYLFQGEELLHSVILSLRKRHSDKWASLDFGGDIYFIWACYLNPITESPQNLPALNGAPNKRKSCFRSRLLRMPGVKVCSHPIWLRAIPAKVLVVGKGNVEWVVEEYRYRYQL